MSQSCSEFLRKAMLACLTDGVFAVDGDRRIISFILWPKEDVPGTTRPGLTHDRKQIPTSLRDWGANPKP